MKKLHLGCGKRDFPGFINVDLADYPHIHHRRSVDDLSLFDEDSVDLIYASHVFEYFKLSDVSAVLKEWRRVLRPGGVLKLAVPDLQQLTAVYQRTRNARDIQGPIYGIMDFEADGKHNTVYHKVLYDFELLKKVLEENGFSKIRRYDWQEFVPAGMEDHSMAYIPSRDYENGTLVSLNVEAQKAGDAEAATLSFKHAVSDISQKIKKKFLK